MENALADVSREEQRVRLLRRDGGEDAEFRDAAVLRFVHDDMGERFFVPCGIAGGDVWGRVSISKKPSSPKGTHTTSAPSSSFFRNPAALMPRSPQ